MKPPGEKLPLAMERLLGDGLDAYYADVDRNREFARLVERQRDQGGI